VSASLPARCAGILIPLFALRAPGDYGRGDIGGLRGFAELALATGHRLIQLLPIDETAPGEASPYSAMSLMAIDPSYIAIDPAGDDADPAIAGGGRSSGSVDLRRLRELKERRLEAALRRCQSAENDGEREAFAAFKAAEASWLDSYALFRALKERCEEREWSKWPAPLSRHEAEGVGAAARELAARIETLRYFQFVAHRQWNATRAALRSRGVYLGGDLAFSAARDSVEVWANQEMYDLTRAVGAPPDAFSPTGQRWGLPMPNWRRMRADGFRLLRERIRHARKLYDVLRIDHVVGLFRTYAYPCDGEGEGAFDPADEAEQRAQGREILGIILEEAGPMRLIAEDLGVIPGFVREVMAEMGIPGYKVPRWERDYSAADEPFIEPHSYPMQAVVTTGTHDTETLAEWWEAAGKDERAAFLSALHIGGEASAARAQLDEATREAILEEVYRSPAQLALTPIQDLFGWRERINVPGTIGAANWSWRLPFDPGEALRDPAWQARLKRIRAISERTGRFASSAG